MGNKLNTYQLDHLVYTAPTLEMGMDTIEQLLGTRPVLGGRHPGFGTHNALLALGPSIYFEVIAPDPNAKIPDHGLFLEEFYQKPPQLATWVLRRENIEEVASTAMEAGVGLGAVEPCSRKRPDGSVLSWKLTNPYAMPLGGAIPFLISWGDSQHPSSVLPQAGTLIHFAIEHPEPQLLKEQLTSLNASVEIIPAKEVRLRASIKTSNGVVILV